MAEPVRTRRIIVAISGASGAVYGARLLQVLRGLPGIETHLVVSDAGWRNLQHELGMERPAAQALAHQVHDVNNVGAAIASGSFQCHAMVVAPCSMRTLAAIAHGLADNLLTRAADVMLKERRRLVLMVRETPLHLAHLLPAPANGGGRGEPQRRAGAGPHRRRPPAGTALAGPGAGCSLIHSCLRLSHKR